MPEQGPHNPDYLEHHPNAVADINKAEVMAYASKKSEEKVVELTRRLEDEAISRIQRDPQRSTSDSITTPAAYNGSRNVADQANIYREQANQQAKAAGEVYDYGKKLREGLTDSEIRSNAEA